ncbi:unnamed protein product [Diamesa serratosioi]
MEGAKQLLDLHDEILEEILSYLDADSLLNATETCYRINDIVSSTDKLTKKIKLVIKFREEFEVRYSIKHYLWRLRSLLGSQRRYHSLTISHLTKDMFNNNKMKSLLMKIFVKFGANISKLNLWFMELSTCTDFTDIMSNFKNVTACELQMIKISPTSLLPANARLSMPYLKDLFISCCHSFCAETFYSCDKLKKLVLFFDYYNRSYFNIETFEDFLLKQQSLKVLDVGLGASIVDRMFKVDRTDEVKFSLDSLKLQDVYFEDKSIALKFFQTQKQLKKFEFYLKNEKDRNLDSMQFYEGILKHVFQSPVLVSVDIVAVTYQFLNMDFLNGITNNNVKKLDFRDFSGVSYFKKNCEFFQKMTKIFPNINDVFYEGFGGNEIFAGIASLKNLDTLTIAHQHNKCLLENIYVSSGKLTNFEYHCCSCEIENEDLMVGDFLMLHRTLKNLKVSTVMTPVLAGAILEFIPNIESLNVRCNDINEFNNFGPTHITQLNKLHSLTLTLPEQRNEKQQLLSKIPMCCNRPGLEIKFE